METSSKVIDFLNNTKFIKESLGNSVDYATIKIKDIIPNGEGVYTDSELSNLNSFIDKVNARAQARAYRARNGLLTPLDYKGVPKEILEEFKNCFDEFFSKEGKGSGESTYRNFYYSGGCFRIVSKFGYSRSVYDNMILFTWSQACLSIKNRNIYNAYYESNINDELYVVMRKYMHNMCVSEGYPTHEIHMIEGDYDLSYNNVPIFSDSDMYALQSFDFNFSIYNKPNMYENVHVDKDTGKLSITYKGRQSFMKVGKGIKRIFASQDIYLTDENLKNAVMQVTNDFSNYEFKIVEGKDIDKYYLEENYNQSFDTGSLGSSCMRHQECVDGDFFEVYKDNAKMLILVGDDDKIIGRAILWDAIDVSDGSDCKVMDRIYGRESTYKPFKQWALDNGYYRRRYQSYDNEYKFVCPETGKEVSMLFEISVNLSDYSNVPYMDTFAWGDDSCIRNEEGFGWYSARDTGGELEGRSSDYWDD